MIQTPKGIALELPLKQSLNTDTIDYDVKRIDMTEPSPHLLFNGIVSDGGVMGLVNEVVGDSTDSYDIFFDSNGNKVEKIYNNARGRTDISLNDEIIGSVGNWSVKSSDIIPGSYGDVMPIVGGKLLALSNGFINDKIYLYELDALDFSVIRSKNVTANNENNAGIMATRFVKKYGVTYDTFDTYFTIKNKAYVNIIKLGLIAEKKEIVVLPGGDIIGTDYTNVFMVGGSALLSTNERSVFVMIDNNPVNIILKTYANVCHRSINPSNSILLSIYQGKIINLELTSTAIIETSTILNEPVIVRNSIDNYYYSTGIIHNSTTLDHRQYIFYGDSNSGGVIKSDNYYTAPADQQPIITPEAVGCIEIQFDLLIKLRTLNNVLSIISFDTSHREVGCSLNEFGNVDQSYLPFGCLEFNKLYYIYKDANSNFILIKLNRLMKGSILEVSSGLIKINCNSEKCLIDIQKKKLINSSSVYNYSFIINYTPSSDVLKTNLSRNEMYSALIEVKYFLLHASLYSNPFFGAIVFNGIEVTDYVDVFFNDIYFVSQNNGVNIIKQNLIDTLYIGNSNYFTPAGAKISNDRIELNQNTAIKTINYDGYNPLNVVNQTIETFTIYGQLYGYDGSFIYQISSNNNVIVTPLPQLVRCSGLRFLTNSQTQAYFISDFDNSLFTFNGGREVIKYKKLNRMDKILSAKYSVMDNFLILFTDNNPLIIFDGILSTLKVGDNYPYSYDNFWLTSKGFYLIDLDSNIVNIKYSRSKDKGQFTEIQTAFYGICDNNRLKLHDIMIVMSLEMTTAVKFDGKIILYTQNNDGIVASEFIDVSGFIKDPVSNLLRIRYLPKVDTCLAFSIGIAKNDSGYITPIILSEIVVYYTPDAMAIVSNVVGG